MTAFQLRDYQQAAIQAILEAEDQGLKRIVVALPTGAGKTVIFSSLLSILPRKALVLAHRSELLEQARDKIARTLGSRRTIALEQGPHRAPADADIVIASIRSLHKDRLDELMTRHAFGLVIYDECHHAPADDNTRVLRQLGAFEPDWDGLLVGFTATTGRGDRRGLEEVFQQISYHRGLPAMIREGYLVHLRGFRVATEADLRAITPAGDGDFGIEELATAIDIRGRNALVARTIQELCRDRKTLVFCVTVQHARNLAQALNDVGVPCGMVHGEMAADERARVLSDFQTGHYAALTNVGVLTEGFDEPSVSCVAMARPTRSDSLYTQCVGRGTRLHPGKADCLILDFVDVSELSLVGLPSLFGLPPQLDLAGDDVLEAEERLGHMFEDFPTFELPPNTITLSEIEERARQFDPLTLDIDPDVAAISGNAWTSLGRAGLVLHYLRSPERLGEFLVLDSREPGKKRYQVFQNQRPVETFSRLVDAVEAVDYEVQALGPVAEGSAQPHGSWRRMAPSPAQQAALGPARVARDKEEAVRLLAFAKYGRTGR